MPDSAPAVSVIVPVRNEADHIRRTLESLLSQKEPPGGFELLIVDGMSEDGTRDILAEAAARDERVRLIDNPDMLTPHAFNRGIEIARGGVIILMGAHNVYAPDYIHQSVQVLEETGADNVGGAMVCRGETYIQQAVALAFHSPFGVGGSRWHNPEFKGETDTVFGGAYRRDVFRRIGLFDTELARNQDDEFNLRLSRAGGRIYQSPRIRSWYTPRRSLRTLFGQYRQYGYWKVRVIQKHRMPASFRHLVPGVFVLWLVLTAVAGLAGTAAGAFGAGGGATDLGRLGIGGFLLAMAAYLGANVAASLLTASKGGWRFLPVLPAVFACYHFGYGIGFLEGVRDFIILRRKRRAGKRTTLTR